MPKTVAIRNWIWGLLGLFLFSAHGSYAQTTSAKDPLAETAQRLAREYNVTLVGSWSGGDLANAKYLIRIFELLGRRSSPIELEYTNELFYPPVRGGRDKNTLVLSHDAFELRPPTSDDTLPPGSGETYVTYRMDLLKSLLAELADEKDLARILKKKFGLSLGPPSSTLQPEMFGTFTRDELLPLVQLLLDIHPDHTRIKSLERIVRAAPGIRVEHPRMPGTFVAAQYDGALRALVFFDDAFGGKSPSIDHIVAHEYGHAVWEGLGDDVKEGYAPTAEEILTDYSMVSKEELFAEHYALYMVEPDRFKKTALNHYRFFERRVFNGTRYFKTVADQYKVYVEQKGAADTQPPTFEDVEGAIQLVDRPARTDWNRTVTFTLLFKTVADDLSGVDHGTLYFQSEQGDIQQSGQGFRYDVGRRGYFATAWVDLARAKATRLYLTGFSLVDAAGNERRFSFDPGARAKRLSIDVPGTSERDTRPVKIAVGTAEDVHLRVLPDDGEMSGHFVKGMATVVEISFPIKVAGGQKIPNGTACLRHPKTEQRLCAPIFVHDEQKTPGRLIGEFLVDAFRPSGTWKLERIEVQDRNAAGGNTGLGVDALNISINIPTKLPDNAPAEIDLKGVRPRVVQENGGSEAGTSIEVEVPYSKASGQTRITVWINDPNGKSFCSSISALDRPAKDTKTGAVVSYESCARHRMPEIQRAYQAFMDGSFEGKADSRFQWVTGEQSGVGKVRVKLPPYFTGGVYTIEYISIEEEDAFTASSMDSPRYSKGYSLVQRNIQYKISVQRPREAPKH
ncbi:MAG: hypothetical protein V1495_03215 [Pseudomonadota bacterium]